MTLPRSIRAWLLSVGDMLEFWGRVMGRVYDARVFRFFGESLRQAGILIAGSLAIILGLVFVLGLQCGLEGAYGARTGRLAEGNPGQPPIGARGLPPQKIWVVSRPMRWMPTMLATIAFAVARPTPTGPPPAK